MPIPQMTGFPANKVRAARAVPANYEPVAALPRQRGRAARRPASQRNRPPRTPLAAFVFEGAWPGLADERYDQAAV